MAELPIVRMMKDAKQALMRHDVPVKDDSISIDVLGGSCYGMRYEDADFAHYDFIMDLRRGMSYYWDISVQKEGEGRARRLIHAGEDICHQEGIRLILLNTIVDGKEAFWSNEKWGYLPLDKEKRRILEKEFRSYFDGKPTMDIKPNAMYKELSPFDWQKLVSRNMFL